VERDGLEFHQQQFQQSPAVSRHARRGTIAANTNNSTGVSGIAGGSGSGGRVRAHELSRPFSQAARTEDLENARRVGG